jgi:hypothetical protein
MKTLKNYEEEGIWNELAAFSLNVVLSEDPGEIHETPYSLRSGRVSIFEPSTPYFIELRFQKPQTAL